MFYRLVNWGETKYNELNQQLVQTSCTLVESQNRCENLQQCFCGLHKKINESEGLLCRLTVSVADLNENSDMLCVAIVGMKQAEFFFSTIQLGWAESFGKQLTEQKERMQACDHKTWVEWSKEQNAVDEILAYMTADEQYRIAEEEQVYRVSLGYHAEVEFIRKVFIARKESINFAEEISFLQ